jgi:hypothetical protein
MAAATLTLLVLTLTGQTVALRSDKPFVTSGESARIELSALDDAGRPLRDAQVSLSVNAGSVTEPVSTPEGTFTATFQPAAQEGPQVALFHATVKQGAGSSSAWLALPIHGAHQLRVKAPARSRVRATVGAASFGPVTASASGEATVPVKLPPGISSAEVTTVDRSGRSRTQTISLPVPRFARIRIVAPEPPVQDTPIRLQGFVVDESGNPAVALPPLAVSVERGLLGPIEAKEGGLFEIPYTAPAPGGGPVHVSAAPVEEPERAFTLQLEPLPALVTPPRGPGPAGGPSPVAAADPLSLGRPWQPTAGVFLFAQTNAAASNSLGLRLEGALRISQTPWEALLLLEGRQNKDVSEQISPRGGVQVTKTFSLRGLSARVGARWSRPILGRGLLFADATAGFLGMTGNVRLQSEEESFTSDLSSNGLALSAGAGLGWSLGPGRLSGQLQWALAPGQGQVRGNLGGLSLAAGYQFPLGGGSRP